MQILRRELLRGLGGLAACTLAGCAESSAGSDMGAILLDEPEFLHGVASGDPQPNAVMLWTRLTPSRTDAGPFRVQWEIALDREFQSYVNYGEATAAADSDYTIKIDAGDLDPATTYYYRFIYESTASPIGRTRTAPEGSVDRLRFAVASCSSYAHGYFHGYRAIADRPDLDAIIHLGDYIYEYGSGEYGDVRPYDPPHEILSLADYRRRYAQYRLDADLQAVHRELPMIAVWDDHEIANNAFRSGAENHNPELGEGDYADRKRAALTAYFEWMPIRDADDHQGFRHLAYGDLADLILLDTRSWGRDLQIASQRDPEYVRSDRQLLGADQEAWLATIMRSSSARWRFIGQQVMVGPLPLYFNPDDWRGYPAARTRFLDILAEHAAKDTVVLTGDVHSSWAMNLVHESSDESVAVELVAPGITSPGLDERSAEPLHAMLLAEPHVEYVQLWRRGYMLLDIDHDRVRATFHHYDAVEAMDAPPERLAATCTTYAGDHHVSLES